MRRQGKRPRKYGRVAKWSNAPVCKTGIRGSESLPALKEKKIKNMESGAKR